MKLPQFKFNRELALLVAIVALLPLSAFVAYQYRSLGKGFRNVSEENLKLTSELGAAKIQNEELTRHSADQQAVIDSFNGQIENISSTVGALEKLSKTDKELLQKYSKIFFLNEHYVPDALAKIDDAFVFKQNGGNALIHDKVWPYLKKLILEAEEDGVELLVVSAFRSFDAQASLKTGYQVTYGAGTANQFSADQGYSEHQLGTSVDFTTKELGAAFTKFGSAAALDWLENNAHKHGFILSYPAGNAYYRYEPWHWRFVGVALAGRLKEEGKFFYDLEQREIDKYLVRIFD